MRLHVPAELTLADQLEKNWGHALMLGAQRVLATKKTQGFVFWSLTG